MSKKEKIIGSIIILVIFVILMVIGYINTNSKQFKEKSSDVLLLETTSNNKSVNNENLFDEGTSQKAEKVEYVTVEIKGEIVSPGVYTLQKDSRVKELIDISGGFTNDADRENIVSLAKKLKDEDCIIIYNKNNINSENIEVINTKNNLTTNNLTTSTSDGKVNLNTSTKEELKTVPGIGDVTAQKIIDYREENGGFKTVEDLKNVDRIGDKTFEKLKDKVTVD